MLHNIGNTISLVFKSLLNRRATAILTVASIAVSAGLLSVVDRVRTDTQTSFANTISGTDLIIGARSGDLNLLLYSVFRIGNPTTNITWDSYETIRSRPEVDWAIPISLGDAHRGYRVLATNVGYFDHYRYADRRPLAFREGGPFAAPTDTVIGAEVADQLGYDVGREIVVSHGLTETSFLTHDEDPFTVTGILERTGTPVDRTVHISLSGMDMIHSDGDDHSGDDHSDDDHSDDDHSDGHSDDDNSDGDGHGHDHSDGDGHSDDDHSDGHSDGDGLGDSDGHSDDDGLGVAAPIGGYEPEAITAFLIGVKSKTSILALQRDVNEFEDEPMTAVIPGVALQQLWGLIRVAEYALFGVSAMVVLASVLGLLATLLVSLNERRREMSVLRSVGARPGHIFALLLSEAAMLAFLGALSGLLLIQLGILTIRRFALTEFGIQLSVGLRPFDLYVLAGILGIAVLVSVIPAWRAYRNSLADGLTVRL